MDILSATILFFLILDPLGNVPIFISHLEKCENRFRVLARELLLALAILFLFLFFGKQMLEFLHLEQTSVSLAGAIILFIIALRMIFPVSKQYGDEDMDDDPFIVPLAIPLVAGPSILATLILLASKHPEQFNVLAIALFIAWLLSAIILFSATAMQKYLGKNGMIAIERLMGMILIAIAVQMFLDAIRAFLVSIKI
ncbi:NAAT family transporter [Marinicella sp. S1101]|uniref:MarC family protein n=1 Tax=Marinicella marina TaxID=2996016 RepID=UPI002260C505|nr:MarC family protein [Marinicella marina]MCX7552686.1 NAAT family transporter [Marinicella marina]MDJ1139562.1 MarC family protein [Marinicella marina]